MHLFPSTKTALDKYQAISVLSPENPLTLDIYYDKTLPRPGGTFHS